MVDGDEGGGGSDSDIDGDGGGGGGCGVICTRPSVACSANMTWCVLGNGFRGGGSGDSDGDDEDAKVGEEGHFRK